MERSLSSSDDSLMAEVLEDHIRLHMLTPDKYSAPPTELAEVAFH